MFGKFSEDRKTIKVWCVTTDHKEEANDSHRSGRPAFTYEAAVSKPFIPYGELRV
jgi:hypothetical protein